jgi:CubicO group peptidase (beta-lactamase class C family)
MQNVFGTVRLASLWRICLTWAGISLLAVTGQTATAQSSPSSSRNPSTLTKLDGHTLTAAQATQAIERVMAQKHIPGLAVSVLNANKIVYLKAFGTRNTAQKALMTDSTVMPALSLTDAVLAVSIMQLVDKKVIDLDTPITQYLPKPLSSYPEYETLAKDDRSKRITPRMLLDHTSGLPDCRLSDTTTSLTLQSDPGRVYRYSNAGFALLSMVTEQVTKQPLRTFLSRGVLKEFSLPNTRLPGDTLTPDNFATGYTTQAQPVAWPHPIGQCLRPSSTTLRDMTRFLQAILDGTGLSLHSRVDMFKPQLPILNIPTNVADKPMRISYGLGWHVFSSPYGPGFYELASSQGWSHYMVAFDDPKIAIIFMTNDADGQKAFAELLPILIGDTFTPESWSRYP